jgi:hypothetical protein
MVAAVLGGVLVLAGILYLAGYLLTGDNVPRKAQISGVAVGGLSRSEAIQKLSVELGARAGEPLNLTVGDSQAQLKPADAGLSVDYAKSVDAAGGGKSLNPLHILKTLTGGSAIDAVVVVDQAKLQAGVGQLAKTFNHEPVDAAVTYRGTKIKQKRAREGTVLRQDEATATITSSFLKVTGPITLPADITRPAITDDEADKVVATFAKPAIAAPIKVNISGAGSFEISPRMLAESISFLPQDGNIQPALDEKKLRLNADPAVKKVELVEPKNATVRLVNGKPKVIPAVNGTIAADNLKKAVEPVLLKPAAERGVSVQLTGAKATFSTADAKLGIKHVTGQFDLLLSAVPQHQHRPGRGPDQWDPAQARRYLLAEPDRRGANQGQRLH